MFESLAAKITVWKVDTFVAVKLDNLNQKPRVVAELIRLLHDRKPACRAAAAKALGMIGNPGAVAPLIAALADEDAKVRRCAAHALGELKDIRAVEPLIKVLGDFSDPFTDFNYIVADALSMLGEPLWSMLIHLQFDRLADSDDPRATDVLIKALSIRWLSPTHVINALGKRKDPRALEPLLSVLAQGNHETRMAVLDALVELRDARAIEPLTEAIEEHRIYKVLVRHMNDYDEWETLEDRDESGLIREALENLTNGLN